MDRFWNNSKLNKNNSQISNIFSDYFITDNSGNSIHSLFNENFSMKVLTGKRQLATFKNSLIYVDFDELLRYKGERLSIVRAEYGFGRMFFYGGLFLFFGSLILLFLAGELKFNAIVLPIDILELMPSISLLPITFGFYLSRNRDIFDHKIKDNLSDEIISNFASHDEVTNKEIDISVLMSIKLKSFMDYAYFNHNQDFLIETLNYAFSQKSSNLFIEKRLGLNLGSLREASIKYFLDKNTSFDAIYFDLFIRLFDEAVKFESEKIDDDILFFTLLKYYLVNVLLDFGITELELEGLRRWFKNENKKNEYYRRWQRLSKLKPKGAINSTYTSKATPTLDQYGIDFTNSISNRNFVLTLGKEYEMGLILNMLQRENGTAIMILGEPGVGKTQFIKHLATRMVVEDVPKTLQDYRLVVLDLNKIFTQTSTVENFKVSIQKMVDEVKNSGNIIICFEEISQIFNIRDEGKLEVINLLTNSIDNSHIKILATATPENYKDYIQPNKSFASKFENITLKEPDPNVLLQILLDEIPRLESKYRVSIQITAIKRIVEFGYKFDYERAMPDKGIDLLEEAIVNAQAKGLNYLDLDTVDELFKNKTGVNVGTISEAESSNLQKLESKMHERVIGQDDAIHAIASAIRRSRSGLSNKKRPIASFLFFGPTGVGKTEVAKTLAETYYGDENLMIRIDMSEYQEDKNLDRLIGYTDEKGTFNGGYLTEKVKSRPFSLILFDEIEKANRKVLDLFLQILDDGFVTDGLGRRVDFTNTIIIMTSNAGTKEITELLNQGVKYHDIERKVLNILRDNFKIEFLNRFDKLVMFKSLSQNEVKKIVSLMLNQLNDKLGEQGISISWNKDTEKEISQIGYSEIYGARELRRVIQEQIEDQLADLIITGDLKSGKTAVFEGVKVVKIND